MIEYLIGFGIIAIAVAMFWLIGATVKYCDIKWLQWFNDDIDEEYYNAFDRFILNFITGLMICCAACMVVLIILIIIAGAGAIGHEILSAK